MTATTTLTSLTSLWWTDEYAYCRVSYDCYYDPDIPDFVVVDFSPERTMMWLLLWSLVPASVMICSCVYICVCSK
jgi:hypothetical protein